MNKGSHAHLQAMLRTKTSWALLLLSCLTCSEIVMVASAADSINITMCSICPNISNINGTNMTGDDGSGSESGSGMMMDVSSSAMNESMSTSITTSCTCPPILTATTTTMLSTTSSMAINSTVAINSTSVAVTSSTTMNSSSITMTISSSSMSTTSSVSVTTTTSSSPSMTVVTTGTPGGDGDTSESSGGNTAGIAAGLSLGLGLPIIILTIIAIIICYKLYIAQPGRRRIKRKSDSKQLLDEEYNINGSAVVDSTIKKETAKETSFNRPSYPAIELADLPRVVSDMHENYDAGFAEEYRFIQQASPALSQTDAYIDVNMEKNRYRNILPFNDTRVFLKAGGDGVTDNYINANYIEGYSGKVAYIATQGPLPNTVSHFWQMVWEQKCEIIVMLTGLIEGGKRKCTQYWPEPQDGALQYGNFEVKLVSQKHYSFYTYSTMEISQKHSTDNTTMRSDERTIQHFSFTQWPDFGVPTDPQSMLRFTRIVRGKISPRRNVPVLVHCSAGVGRTGTFITIDVMLQKMAKQQALNIKEFVLGMRYQRNNMVQTERQYVFLYDALLEAHLYGDTAVEAKNIKRHVWSLTQENQATGITEMEEEFNHLPPCNYAQETFAVALSTDNMRKNRDKSYIPFDFLRITVGDEEQYINAAPVKGYSEETEFIATQHPLVNTISDFWTMICEQDVKVIVMLGSLKNIKDSYLNTTRHPVEITKKEDTKFYTVTHITVQKPQEHSVVHYLFKAWVPERDVPTRKSMLALLKEVRSVNDPGHPIVIHSSTSMAKEGSGVYCALTVCLDSLNNEGYVDVFQTVRSLREQRPYILYSKELYNFIYLCLVEFLQSNQDN